MKVIIVLATLCVLAAARPQAEIVRQDFDNIGVDGYSFA